MDLPLNATGTAFETTAATAFTGQVAAFIDVDPSAKSTDFTAVIDWGDGQSSDGTIAVDRHGGFLVNGSPTCRGFGPPWPRHWPPCCRCPTGWVFDCCEAPSGAPACARRPRRRGGAGRI